ncbi:MAG: hypothetical protein SNG10_02490 [Rikenellaceae bacterium]
MNIESIRTQLAELNTLVEGWSAADTEVSTIERDIALDRVKSLYEELRFSESIITHNVANVEEGSDEESEPEVEVEITYYEGEDEEFEQEQEQEIEEVLIEPEPEPEPEPESEPEMEQEPLMTISIEDISIVADLEEEAAAEHIAAPQSGRENALFDLDTIPIRTKSRRSAILSLYSDGVRHTTQQSAENKSTSQLEIVEDLDVEEPTPRVVAQQPHEEIEPEIKQPEIETMESNVEVEELELEEIELEELELEEIELEEIELEEEEEIELEEITLPLASSTPTIGDMLSSNVETIAQRYATAESHTPTISETKPLSSINDRYLVAQELFGGDMSACEKMLADLEQIDNFDDSMIYIVENYEWNSESEATKLMLRFLENKFEIN